jgi:signal transduction histidine kinase
VTRRLLLGYLGLTLLVLAALEVPLGIQNARTERRDLEAKVEHDATALASIVQDALRTGSHAQLEAVAGVSYSYRSQTGGRVLVVRRDGTAVVDTNPTTPGREGFTSRPEIAAALNGRVASGTRHSETLHSNLLYVAVPVASGGIVDGAVRITYPTSAVDARVTRYWLMLLAVAGIVLGLAALVGVRLGIFVIEPLHRLEQAAASVGEGDLGTRAGETVGPPEVRSLARVFNDTVAKLEQLLRSQEEFVADASHQLRTPLTALRLRLENLERDVAASGRRELDGALAEVERLASLVEGLLALARADAAAEPAGTVDLGKLVRDRADAWSSLAGDRGLHVVVELDAAATARASESRLRQVLDNLVENAIEASPPGGTILLRAQGSEVHVRDEGPGLGEDERERAFDRFWRGRAGPGSGLGLAIVRRLVEADGGEVRLEPGDGAGLVAVVRLRAAV